DGEAWGRPVDTLQLHDGALLVSDDYADVIYRISYKSDDADTDASESETTADFAMPESVVAHADGRQFVTDIGEFGKDGDGRVTVVDPDGERRTLADGLDDPKGIDLWRDALYVADNTRLRRVGLDGDTSVVADTGDFPGTATFLNDVEIDGEGRVYVSDSGSEAGDNAGIYRVSPEGEVELVFDATESEAMSRPNGLLMDGPDALLVADFGNGRLFRLQLDSGELTTLNNGFGGADGLVRDSHGNLYVSDWNNGRVFMLHDLRATPMLVRDGFKAAADIALSADGRKLLVPDMKAGSLQTLPLD
ncbi:unnamed protein product, partial [Chrysoparadoxa australica]